MLVNARTEVTSQADKNILHDARKRDRYEITRLIIIEVSVNDPSAGSPTETLLRLLLPLDDQVCFSSRIRRIGEPTKRNNP